MRPRKLTDEVLARIRIVEAARSAIPTREELAVELGISKSSLDHAVRKCKQVAITQNVPHGTSNETATKLQNA